MQDDFFFCPLASGLCPYLFIILKERVLPSANVFTTTFTPFCRAWSLAPSRLNYLLLSHDVDAALEILHVAAGLNESAVKGVYLSCAVSIAWRYAADAVDDALSEYYFESLRLVGRNKQCCLGGNKVLSFYTIVCPIIPLFCFYDAVCCCSSCKGNAQGAYVMGLTDGWD